MKTFVKIFLLLVACSGFASCGDETDSMGPYTESDVVFSVNSDSIQASGKDEAVFKVTCKGIDVTAQAKIMEKSTMTIISNKIFTSKKPGTYTFVASYGTVNNKEVTVRVVAEKLYLKNLLMMDFTSTECPGCPGMTAFLANLLQQEPERLNLVAVHLPLVNVDSMAILEIGGPLRELVGIKEFPTVCVDLSETFIGAAGWSLATFQPFLDGRGDVGIALAATVANEKVTLDIKVRPSKAYKESSTLSVAILEDGMVYSQLDQLAPGGIVLDYVHNYVVRKYETNVYGDPIPAGELVYGKTYQKTITFNLPKDKEGKVSVVVYVSNSDNKVVNSRRVRIPGSNDFQPVEYVSK